MSELLPRDEITPDMQEAARALVDALRRFVEACRTAAPDDVPPALRTLGLHRLHVVLLRALVERPAPTMATLAARARVHPMTAAGASEVLLAHGLVRRVQARPDQRTSGVALTALGHATTNRLPPSASQRLAHALAHSDGDPALTSVTLRWGAETLSQIAAALLIAEGQPPLPEDAGAVDG